MATSDQYRIMTVCTGNICRSPMAEVVLRDRFAAAGLDAVVVYSTGVSSEEQGNPMDRRARQELAARGYEPGDHWARKVTRQDIFQSQLVLAMTSAHARRLQQVAGGRAAHIRLYRTFDPALSVKDRAATMHTSSDLFDPWYGGPEQFVTCLDMIEAAADGIVAHVRSALRA